MRTESTYEIHYYCVTLSGVSSEMRNTGTFWQGFASGAAASLISGAVGGVCDLKNVPAVWTKTAMIAAGGIGGGVSSTIAGGEFIDGFCNGLICAGLNHALHYVAKNVTGPDDPPGKSPSLLQQKINQIRGKYEILNFALGAAIASYAGSEFNQNMFWRYWYGLGDYTLTEAEFNDIVENAVPQGEPIVSYQNGQQINSQLVSLYGTSYAGSIGSATLYLDNNGNPIGFFDTYDFNVWNANRSFDAQVKTMMVSGASTFNVHSKPFIIKYP